MKKSEILRRAQEHLAKTGDDDKTNFICTAIAYSRAGTEQQRVQLKCWISSLLDNYRSYTSWLMSHYPDIWDKATYNDLQTARHQWLDWMIQYWEEQGD